MIKIYKLNNEVAGWIDLDRSEFDTLGTAIEQDGSFELDITLEDDETLIDIDVTAETATISKIPPPDTEEVSTATPSSGTIPKVIL